jgi:hypothetical protein
MKCCPAGSVGHTDVRIIPKQQINDIFSATVCCNKKSVSAVSRIPCLKIIALNDQSLNILPGPGLGCFDYFRHKNCVFGGEVNAGVKIGFEQTLSSCRSRAIGQIR